MDSATITAIFQSAGAGTALIVILILTGQLVTQRYVRRVEQDADHWKAAYDAEREVSAAKDRALAVQAQRADAAVEVATLTKELLEDLRRRTGAAPKT